MRIGRVEVPETIKLSSGFSVRLPNNVLIVEATPKVRAAVGAAVAIPTLPNSSMINKSPSVELAEEMEKYPVVEEAAISKPVSGSVSPMPMVPEAVMKSLDKLLVMKSRPLLELFPRRMRVLFELPPRATYWSRVANGRYFQKFDSSAAPWMPARKILFSNDPSCPPKR